MGDGRRQTVSRWWQRWWQPAPLFAVALLAAAGLLVISEVAHRHSVSQLHTLGATSTARTHLQDMLRRLLDAETGQRGYLLTSHPQYLEPYREASEDIRAALKALAGYYARVPAAQAQMQRLNVLALERLSELDATILLYDEGRVEAWKAVVLAGIGNEQMAELRRVSEQLMAAEDEKLARSRAEIEQTLMQSRIGVATMMLLSLLALAMILKQGHALTQARAAQQRVVQQERDTLEAEVQRRTAQLVELTQHLQAAREDERRRLARELHDELGALLTAAKLDAARIRSRLKDGPPEALERLTHLTDILNSGIALKRRIIEDLRPSSLDNLGLIAALDIQGREFAEATGIQVQRDLSPVTLDADGELTVYRLVQEAYTNIAKHAQASNVQVRLVARDGMAEISVQDDGLGFEPGTQHVSAHGLLGMQYRVTASGGRLDVDSAPGHGARISAQLPLQPAAAEPPAAID